MMEKMIHQNVCTMEIMLQKSPGVSNPVSSKWLVGSQIRDVRKLTRWTAVESARMSAAAGGMW